MSVLVEKQDLTDVGGCEDSVRCVQGVFAAEMSTLLLHKDLTMAPQDTDQQADEQNEPNTPTRVNEGVRRLSIVVGLVPLILCSLIALAFTFYAIVEGVTIDHQAWKAGGGFFAAGLVLCGVFWSVVRAVAWIIEGFRRGRGT